MSNLVYCPDKNEKPLANSGFDEMEHVSLCEALDRVLNKGAVVTGDLMISVADVDLIYPGLRCILTSIETARGTSMETKEGMNRGMFNVAAGCGMESRNAGL